MNFPRRIAIGSLFSGLRTVQCPLYSVHPYSIHYNYGTPARDQLSIDSQFGGILPSTLHFSQNTTNTGPPSRPPCPNISVLVHVPMSAASSSRCWGGKDDVNTGVIMKYSTFYEWKWDSDKNICFCSTKIYPRSFFLYTLSIQQQAEYLIHLQLCVPSRVASECVICIFSTGWCRPGAVTGKVI